MDMPALDVSIPIGTIYYQSFFKNSLSRTDVTFETSPGIALVKEAQSASFFSKHDDSVFILYEGQKLVSKSKFFLPELHATSEKKVIDGYTAQLYTYVTSDGMKGAVWLSKQIPYYVTPGVYFKGLGGIVRIDYEHKKEKWSLDLIKFETITENVSFKENELTKVNTPAEIHFLFKRN